MPRMQIGALLCALAPFCVQAQELPQKYALLIGIDVYQHQGEMTTAAKIPQLAFAARDAHSLKDKLERQGYITTELPNEFATRRSVVLNLLRLSETIREEDTFILYYAGHGVKRQKTGVVYWLNNDGDPATPDVDGLRVKALIDLVNEIPARRKLVLLDHCYAGQLDDLPSTTGDSAANSRGTDQPSGHLVMSRDALPTEVEHTIAQESRGMAVIAASRGLAYEVTDDRHGVMTAALLTAITTPQADVHNDGNLSVGEIIDYVYREVQRLSKLKDFEQKPVSKIASSNESEMREWEPLMRNLGGTEVGDAVKRYRQQLGRWESQHRIPPLARTDCEAAITRWEQNPALISPNDDRIVTLLREYIDASSNIEEARRAEAIVKGVDEIRETQ